MILALTLLISVTTVLSSCNRRDKYRNEETSSDTENEVTHGTENESNNDTEPEDNSNTDESATTGESESTSTGIDLEMTPVQKGNPYGAMKPNELLELYNSPALLRIPMIAYTIRRIIIYSVRKWAGAHTVS